MTKFKPTPPAKLLRELICYDPLTGECRWRVRRGGTANAGCLIRPRNGQVNIAGSMHIFTRLIWKIKTGKDCPTIIDHKNKDNSDNRWRNLRKATRSQNNVNTKLRKDNSSGYRGVKRYQWLPDTWCAVVSYQHKRYHFGPVKNIEEAIAWRKQKARELHGAFYSE